MGEIHLDHVDGAERGQPVEVGLGVKPLPRGDRTAGRPLHLGQEVETLRRDRLLAPDRVEPFEPADHGGRGPGREPAMKLDHQADAGPDRLAHRRDDLDRRVRVRRIEHLPGRPERVELEGPIALRHGRQSPLGKLGRRARPAIPAVGIRGNALVAPAAQQPVNRLMTRLADQVPAGDLDAR